MRVCIILFLSVALISMADHVEKYPTGHFKSPVRHDLRLSGTFGELRNNHFHAGLDIKSKNGSTGDTIYAAAEGFISRIQVQEYGYGNVLYLQHPNGFTSVYAHLEQFSPRLQEYVRKQQYDARKFEVDLSPPPFQFSVTQSEYIGIMGNTGYSLGPHLHFEIRHTDVQVPVNPLHFGFQVRDAIPPTIQQLLVYEYDDTGRLAQTKVYQPTASKSGQYTLPSMIQVGASKVAFGLRTIDYQEGATNQNGIYSISCQTDDEPSFGFALDEISFQDTRYLNAHIDYKQKIYQNKFYHRCFPLEGNKLPIYYTGADKGQIELYLETPRQVSIRVADFHGNQSRLDFSVKRNADLPPVKAAEGVYSKLALPDEVTVLHHPGIQIVWPEGSFYEKTELNIKSRTSKSKAFYSPHFDIEPGDVPVHTYFDLLIEGSTVPDSLRNKIFIAREEPGGGYISIGGHWVGQNMTAKARTIGTYVLMVDTIPPSISTVHFGPKMTGWRRMAFKISDNMRIRDRGEDLRYDAWVDGEWILMGLDGKNGLLFHEFDGRISAGTHQLEIHVTDDRGNTRVLQKTFTL